MSFVRPDSGKLGRGDTLSAIRLLLSKQMPENPIWINCNPKRVFRIALARAPPGAVIEEVAMSADKGKADATSTAHNTPWLALPTALCGFILARGMQKDSTGTHTFQLCCPRNYYRSQEIAG